MDCTCGMPDCRRPLVRFGQASNGVYVTWGPRSYKAALVRKINDIQLRIARLTHKLSMFIIMKTESEALIRFETCRYKDNCPGYKAGCVRCQLDFLPYEEEMETLQHEKGQLRRLLCKMINLEVLDRGMYMSDDVTMISANQT